MIYMHSYTLNSGRVPAVRLRLERCTAWVKRWSEAMDFLQIIFKTKGKIESSHDFQGT